MADVAFGESRPGTAMTPDTLTLWLSAGKPITAKARPRGENVVDLIDALRKSIGREGASATEAPKKSGKKPRKAAAGQKEMLMPIAGKKPAKEAAARKPAAKAQRKSA